jgi:hypothetical protein
MYGQDNLVLMLILKLYICERMIKSITYVGCVQACKRFIHYGDYSAAWPGLRALITRVHDKSVVCKTEMEKAFKRLPSFLCQLSKCSLRSASTIKHALTL